MSKIPREKLVRFVAGGHPDEERREVEAALVADPETDRELLQAELDHLFPPDLIKRMAEVAAQADEPVDPQLAGVVSRAVRQTASAELWCLEASEGEPLSTRVARQGKVELTVRRLVRDVGETWFKYGANGNMIQLTGAIGNDTTYLFDALNRVTRKTNELDKFCAFAYDEAGRMIKQTNRDGKIIRHPVEKTFHAVLERVADEPPTFRLTCDCFPAGYTVLGMKLSRVEHRRREPVEVGVQIARLQQSIDQRAKPALLGDIQNKLDAPSEAPLVLSADSRRELSPSPDAADVLDCRTSDFHVQVERLSGDVFIKATMPLHRSGDHVIVEVAYTDVAGNERMRREPVLLIPSRSDRRWSQWALWTVPNLEDHASPQVTLRFCSLGDADLYLLPAEEQRALLAVERSLLLVGNPVNGGFEFRGRWEAQRTMATDPEVGWNLEVANNQEDGNEN